jgi:hypothetical protein
MRIARKMTADEAAPCGSAPSPKRREQPVVAEYQTSTRQALANADCRIVPSLGSRRRLRRRWPGASAAAQPWKARAAHAGPHRWARRSSWLLRHPAPVAAQPSSSPPNCPARGHRVNGGPAGRRMRSATPTIDPETTPKGSAPTRKTDKNSQLRNYQDRYLRHLLTPGARSGWLAPSLPPRRCLAECACSAHAPALARDADDPRASTDRRHR